MKFRDLILGRSIFRRLHGFFWGYDLFLGHTKSDNSRVGDIYAGELHRQLGPELSCFYDCREFEAGSWKKQACEILKHSTNCYVLLATPRIFESRAVFLELMYALQFGVPVHIVWFGRGQGDAFQPCANFAKSDWESRISMSDDLGAGLPEGWANKAKEWAEERLATVNSASLHSRVIGCPHGDSETDNINVEPLVADLKSKFGGVRRRLRRLLGLLLVALVSCLLLIFLAFREHVHAEFERGRAQIYSGLAEDRRHQTAIGSVLQGIDTIGSSVYWLGPEPPSYQAQVRELLFDRAKRTPLSHHRFEAQVNRFHVTGNTVLLSSSRLGTGGGSFGDADTKTVYLPPDAFTGQSSSIYKVPPPSVRAVTKSGKWLSQLKEGDSWKLELSGGKHEIPQSRQPYGCVGCWDIEGLGQPLVAAAVATNIYVSGVADGKLQLDSDFEVKCFDLAGQGEYLVGIGEKKVRVWKLKDGGSWQTSPRSFDIDLQGEVQCAAVIDRKSPALVFANPKLGYVELKEKAQLSFLLDTIENPNVHSISLHSSGNKYWLVAGADNNSAYCWQFESKPSECCRKVLSGHPGPVYSVACFDGAVATGSDGEIRYWYCDGKSDPVKPFEIVKGHDYQVTALEFPEGQDVLLSAGSDGLLQTWGLGADMKLKNGNGAWAWNLGGSDIWRLTKVGNSIWAPLKNGEVYSFTCGDSVTVASHVEENTGEKPVWVSVLGGLSDKAVALDENGRCWFSRTGKMEAIQHLQLKSVFSGASLKDYSVIAGTPKEDRTDCVQIFRGAEPISVKAIQSNSTDYLFVDLYELGDQVYAGLADQAPYIRVVEARRGQSFRQVCNVAGDRLRAFSVYGGAQKEKMLAGGANGRLYQCNLSGNDKAREPFQGKVLEAQISSVATSESYWAAGDDGGSLAYGKLSDLDSPNPSPDKKIVFNTHSGVGIYGLAFEGDKYLWIATGGWVYRMPLETGECLKILKDKALVLPELAP